MITLLKIILISMLPISELRGAIPYAITQGVNPFIAFLSAVLGNFLVVPIVFYFLDNLHHYFLRSKHYEKFFNKYIEAKRKKFEKHVGTKFEFWALVIFTGTPLPFTGAWSATILAWFFNLKRRKSYLAIFLGILISGIIVTLTTLGIKSLF